MLHNFFLKKDIKHLRHGSLGDIAKHNIRKFKAKIPKNDLVILVQKFLKFWSKCRFSKSILHKKLLFLRKFCVFNILLPNIIIFNVKCCCYWEILEHRCEGRQSP